VSTASAYRSADRMVIGVFVRREQCALRCGAQIEAMIEQKVGAEDAKHAQTAWFDVCPPAPHPRWER
jgi:hypothetical protein